MTLDYGNMVHSLLWVLQDLYHQPYHLMFSKKLAGGAPVVTLPQRTSLRGTSCEADYQLVVEQLPADPVPALVPTGTAQQVAVFLSRHVDERESAEDMLALQRPPPASGQASLMPIPVTLLSFAVPLLSRLWPLKPTGARTVPELRTLTLWLYQAPGNGSSVRLCISARLVPEPENVSTEPAPSQRAKPSEP